MKIMLLILALFIKASGSDYKLYQPTQFMVDLLQNLIKSSSSKQFRRLLLRDFNNSLMPTWISQKTFDGMPTQEEKAVYSKIQAEFNKKSIQHFINFLIETQLDERLSPRQRQIFGLFLFATLNTPAFESEYPSYRIDFSLNF
jgi:hypothetical protein